MEEFKNKEPTFKINWTSFQQLITIGKTKTIKNALVIMIVISEYIDNKMWNNLSNVKETVIRTRIELRNYMQSISKNDKRRYPKLYG
ncbi:hypothetical protein RFI_32892 [Reticulomyxa filosa]|uniref:Uncharacterized protein n=1 Tax=Reticulomyxa filosa TaxID=46433 RepID=X6LTR6_RETFI|nr:hypothetical protein RFI_32892 [Reticulomyxa filosa]|eukprot:ETO04502.1 hypothetical protein RFI_32892 [Reticulomyxa filosa]